MKIKSITRIDGKIRIVSTNSGQERVDDFDDYGLPEVDHLIKSFLDCDVLYLEEESDNLGEDYFMIGDCYYVGYRNIYISTPRPKPYNYIRIGKSFTTIDYGAFTYIIYGCVNFTTDIISLDWYLFSWIFSKNFTKQFDSKHITEQFLKNMQQ